MAAQNPGELRLATSPTPPRPPTPEPTQKTKYSSGQITSMGIEGFQRCLTRENIDRDTLKACLQDPRAYSELISEAIRVRTAVGQPESIGIILSHLREHNQQINILIEDAFDQAITSHQLNVFEYLVTNFRNEIQKLALRQVFELARQKTTNETSDKAIEYLLTQGLINVNERDSEGSTLLHCAGTSKRPHVIKVLKEKNANPFARDRSGRTAWEVARPTLTLEDLNNWVINVAGVIRRKVDFPLTKIPGDLFYVMDDYHYFVAGKLLPEFLLGKLFSNWTPPCRLLQSLGRESQTRFLSLKEDTILVDMGGNVDFQFTWYISNISSLLGYSDSAIETMIQFQSQTFLEQSATQPQLRFREVSYNAMILDHVVQRPEEKRRTESSSGGGQIQTPAEQDRKAELGVFIPTAGGRSRAVIDTSIHPAREVEMTETTTPVSNTRAKPGARTDNVTPFATPAVPNVVSIVLPYFHSLSIDGLAFRRKFWSTEADEGNEGEESERNRYRRTVNEQQNLSNFHEPRTLDESYYISLNHKQLSERNNDQVIGKLASCQKGDKPLLMVPQLWLWMMDNVIISALPRNIGGGKPGFTRPKSATPKNIGGADPITHLINELYDRNLPVFRNLNGPQLLALIISETINFLARPRSAGLEEPVFYTFERAVAILHDGVQTYVKEYRMDSILIEQEKAFLNQINDVLNELAMTKSIIEQQDKVWKKFYKDFEKVIGTWDANLVRIVTRPNEQIPEFRSRLEKIEKDGERIQSVIQAQLSLKSSHAALKESHNSTILGTAVIGFTIITVIFTPLSFLASLFALSIDRLENNKSPDTFSGNFSSDSSGNSPASGSANSPNNFNGGYSSGVYTTNYIGTWMAVGEVSALVVTILLVWLSFKWLSWRERRTSTKESQVADPFARDTPASNMVANDKTDESRKQGEPSRMARILHPFRRSVRAARQGLAPADEKNNRSRLTGNSESHSVV